MQRLRRIAEEEVFLVVLLAGFALVFLVAVPGYILVADSWLVLMAGREIAQNGLPTHDELTVFGLGRPWTDQQWGAHLALYAVHALGGTSLLVVATGVLVVGAFVIAAAAARSLGAGPRAIALLFFPVILSAQWAWTIRAQVTVLPLYTGLLWLLVSQARRPSRRVYLALPMLLLWANLHGSVVLGASLAVLLGAIELVRDRGRTWRRSLALLALPPLAVLATPYGPVETARYYHLLLVDPPFGDKVTEWQWSDPAVDTMFFYVLAAAALVLAFWRRGRLTAFDLAVLAYTFAGGVLAIRGVPWFALACMILLPVAIGRALEGRDVRVLRAFNRGVAVVAAAAVLVAAVVVTARDDAAYEREKWPAGAIEAVRRATAGGERVFATERYANWLLWKLPELRGRVAFDVRFEIYEPAFFERLGRYHAESGADWKALADGFEVVVVDEQGTSHTADFLSEPDARAVYRDDLLTVILRPGQR
jgi:hypothetical protein